jgi:hypothetical protein
MVWYRKYVLFEETNRYGIADFSFGVRNMCVMDLSALLFEYLCICYVLTKGIYI